MHNTSQIIIVAILGCFTLTACSADPASDATGQCGEPMNDPALQGENGDQAQLPDNYIPDAPVLPGASDEEATEPNPEEPGDEDGNGDDPIETEPSEEPGTEEIQPDESEPCVAEPEQSLSNPASCDEVDNDCDGLIDEGCHRPEQVELAVTGFSGELQFSLASCSSFDSLPQVAQLIRVEVLRSDDPDDLGQIPAILEVLKLNLNTNLSDAEPREVKLFASVDVPSLRQFNGDILHPCGGYVELGEEMATLELSELGESQALRFQDLALGLNDAAYLSLVIPTNDLVYGDGIEVELASDPDNIVWRSNCENFDECAGTWYGAPSSSFNNVVLSTH